MLKLNFYKDKRLGNVNFGKVYGRVKNSSPVGLEELADHMHSHGTVFSPGVIKGVLTDMIRCIRELCLMGQPVKLENLCIISAQVTSTPADDVESFELKANVKSTKLRFTATGASVPKEVTKNAKLEYTALAERIRKGEISLSDKKGEYIAGGEPVVNP